VNTRLKQTDQGTRRAIKRLAFQSDQIRAFIAKIKDEGLHLLVLEAHGPLQPRRKKPLLESGGLWVRAKSAPIRNQDSAHDGRFLKSLASALMSLVTWSGPCPGAAQLRILFLLA